MTPRPLVLALMVELLALALLVAAFTANPFRWEFVIVGIALFAVGFVVRKRYGNG